MSKRTGITIGILQRVLPDYRIALFDALAEAFPDGCSVFAGKPRSSEGLIATGMPKVAQYYSGRNTHLFKEKCYLCLQFGIRGWLNAARPDILILEANPRYLRSRVAIRWMQNHGGKIIGWGLGTGNQGAANVGLRAALRNRFLCSFDALITYSAAGARAYQEIGIPADRVFIAPNAATPKPAFVLPDRPQVYQNGKPVVLFVGRLQERKRVDVLIEACAQLPADQQPLLWIVGDGPIRESLQVFSRKIYPKTEFFGALSGEPLEARFRESDLFVLPGTGGLAVQQAMSFGLPVVVGVADGTQTDLVRPDNGWILPDDTASTLSSVLSDALADIPRLRKMGAASYRIVSQEINVERMVTVFRRAVHKVLEE